MKFVVFKKKAQSVTVHFCLACFYLSFAKHRPVDELLTYVGTSM